MAVTSINSEDRLVQATFAKHLERMLGWDSVYAWNEETLGPEGTLGRANTREAVLARDLRGALERLNLGLPASAIDDAVRDLTVYDVSRSTVQHNREFHRLIRGGVPVEYRDAQGRRRSARARVIDFDNTPGSNRFLAVRELKLTGVRTPNYNRCADLVCFVNGLPLVFIELKAVYKDIREGFDNNLSDYMDENVIAHAFHHNAFLNTQAPGDDQAEGLTFDLSRIDMEKLRDEFAKKVRHKATALRDIREIVEEKLAQMLARNPSRMDYQQKYEEIVADYNREKDRVTIEETFRRLTELIEELDAEQRRTVEKGLSEDELALFDLLKKKELGRAARERVKQASRDLLASINARLKDLDRFWEKEQTKAEIKVFILDEVYASLPTPPFTSEKKEAVAAEVYTHVWQQAVRGELAMAA